MEWAYMFRSWIQNLRQQFAPELRDKTVLLFLDNHTLRECVEATVLLKEANIEVVTFPPNVTHILQPLDVCLARPFKTELRKIFCGGTWQRNEHGYVDPSHTERLRCCMVQSSMAAWTRVHGTDKADTAFKTCGVVPFSDAPLRSQYTTVSDEDMEMKKRQENPTRLWISSSRLTSETMIMRLVDEKRFACPLPETDIVFTTESAVSSTRDDGIYVPRFLPVQLPPDWRLLPMPLQYRFLLPFPGFPRQPYPQCPKCHVAVVRLEWPPDRCRDCVSLKSSLVQCPQCQDRTVLIGFEVIARMDSKRKTQ
jgi:hypothetical protein